MLKVLFKDLHDGRLQRLQFLGYTILLWLFAFAIFVLMVAAIGAGEHLMGGNLQQAQEKLFASFSIPVFIGLGIVMLLFSFAHMNLYAKRIRDIGLPGWWGVLVIILLSIALSLLVSAQFSNGVGTLIWLALLLIPTDTFEQVVS
ncbi:DUF805 domain-containing protein [Solemya velum gill symbiont]|uniref:DUF805 domain-containing protein n=1 Tax=Solemya velum gill symbiont TaxID=2340 RepID=A0A1T2I572_SOVGS|nr:DUF805 domain-containing protein [Solemya velum gill symbiont]OOY34206.1 hypothetical protein BOV88_11470 [Solemya velum gill symbiont]OOY36903.1 hypothetical protein BOV89_10380 [Solemya velum gill symbiont]OOY40065.1 hypothetical protein BOV90_06255 [Solemya velum gill symbiont]OOY44003.1 hypothetical protein BOV92_09825 [Solemya velum gill symbiont]OOY45378.1 hypothetical protein BOV93_13270 [Solemya velum gill symbiont]